MEIDARLTLKPLVPSIASLRFDLVNQVGDVSWRNTSRPVVVTSVTDDSGIALPFIHKRDELLVRLPRPILKGQEYVVEIKAREDTIMQLTAESYLIYNTYAWFPQYGYNGGRFAFDFTIEIHRPLQAMGSGRIVKEWEEEPTKMDCIELRIDDEVQFPSILFGRFLREQGVYSSPVANRDIALSVSAFPTMTTIATNSGSRSSVIRLDGPESSVVLVTDHETGNEAVDAAVVAFAAGAPFKEGYRRFRIKTVSGADDYAMLYEVLRRRYEKREKLPDLIMVDGGRGQLNIAVSVVEGLGLKDAFDIIGIAKKDPDRDEPRDKIYLPGRVNPVNFGKDREALFLLERIRDEAHRFAITFHRQKI